MIKIYQLLNYFIAVVWLINGLICKALNFVPRHEEIVSRILSEGHSRILTILIGCSEILMAFWILSGIKTKLNAVTQIIIIAVMNILEFILVPDLLLWGHYNSLFAFWFILLIYFNEFQLKPKTIKV
ncbi:DoxX-like family protein [Chryseobacterium chendengshani]|uniref:DoxX-like family protein n=1 Tax=Chryseobacterium sp. LJ756 TaxID=2864113 RepID=UPI001C63CCD1|nr:DoxX-like family protein [Chryseobacterium sp. LJ756]MBW7674718.1 DoxX-like family protein [Chryseobacterium sp. LJ756]